MTNEYKKVLFVITEKHFDLNYSNLEDKLKNRVSEFRKIYVYSFNNVNMKCRLTIGKRILNKLKQQVLEQFGNELIDTLIVYSNAEGYMLYNRKYWMPQMKNCKEVLLQHGLLPTCKSKTECVKEYLFNTLFCFLPRYMKYGGDFGEVKADLMILWGDAYKQYCVIEKGWATNRILISGSLLKPNVKINNKTNQNTGLFLLQDFTNSFGINEKMLHDYIYDIVMILLKYFDNIIIRKHPKMDLKTIIYLAKIPGVIISTDILEEDIRHSDMVISFNSAGLIDAYLYRKNIIAIKLKEIPNSCYDIFDNSIEEEKLNCYLSSFGTFKTITRIKKEYFNDSNSQVEVINSCLNYDEN